jgi:hypothetical protein
MNKESFSKGELNFERNKAGGKGTEKDGRGKRPSAAFKPGKKGHKAHQDKALEDIPGGFKLQADKAVLAGAVMVQVGKFKGCGKEGNKDEADGNEEPFLQNFAHGYILSDCVKTVNRGRKKINIRHYSQRYYERLSGPFLCLNSEILKP